LRILWVHSRSISRFRIVVWMMILILLLVCPVASEIDTKPSAPAVTASIEKSTVKVGDLLWITLEYALPEGAHLRKEDDIEGFEKLTIMERMARPGEIKIRFLVDRLETFDIGPICLIYLDKNGNEHRIETSPVTITVESNFGEKSETADLRPIQDIIPTNSRWSSYLLWVTVAAVLAAILLGGWWYKRHRISKIVEKTIEPPHVRAERELERLVTDGYFEEGAVKTFYFKFSEILRQYMGAIRQFPAVEMTTEEIVRHSGNNSQDQEIIQLLKQTDLVKFADSIPTSIRKEKDVLAARNYFRQTSAVMDMEVGQ